MVFGDLDNDQDILLSENSGLAYISSLYSNDGVGNFTEIKKGTFDGVLFASTFFDDVDFPVRYLYPF